MLPLHFVRRHLRRTACVTLLAWVFALMSGVVNACMLQPVDHHAGNAHGSQGEDSGKAGCLKFCADESSALAKNKVSHADLPGPILLDSVPWPSATQLAPVVPWQLVERPPSVGPPLFLRLLRLTT